MDNAQDTPLYRIRHSLAHVLAQAVLEIRPKAKLGFGPPIDNGFYYDFLFDTPLALEDFSDIEARMKRIIKEKQKFEGYSLPGGEAIEYLKKEGQGFKVEYCEDLLKGGETTIGFYRNGPFVDMCAGPHVGLTSEIPSNCFKLDTIAGAYWRGSEKNPQLTRIYALAFLTKAELDDYVTKRELAKERDHRKLGKDLELYLINDSVGPGLPLWMPNGTVLREELERFGKEMEERAGYYRVATPHIAKESLYLTSGHLPYYKDTMFPPMQLEGEANYYLKAMNCPHHHMIYSHRPRSYRELPLRLAEYGTCYRFEPSGTLSGLLRVRCLSMNDAHIYCTIEQLKDELKASFNLALNYYKLFRFEDVRIRLSTHDPENKEKYVDNPELWKFSETCVREVLTELGVNFYEGFGEAAFYGPKIDFQAATALGREETISTAQLDFASPLRFGLKYVAADGKEHHPYIVHRAPLGTHERFLAFLIEHLGGAFPTWMAPVQVQIVPVNEAVIPYALELQKSLRDELLRCEVSLSADSFNKKIRDAVTHKIPNIAIVGGKEAEKGEVTLRRYCVKDQVTMSREAFISRINRLKSSRIMDNFADVPTDG